MTKNFLQFRPHPWHGIDIGEYAPEIVKSFIEITPFDSVKYEICKKTGYIKVDRPQKFSSVPPMLYGFIPQTYCANNVAQLSISATEGDLDPLDICVLSELNITKSDIIIDARIIGGIRLIDSNEADDKIIAVLSNDSFYENVLNISDLNKTTLNRIEHYFLSYKNLPNENLKTKVEAIYDAETAYKVILASQKDYNEHFLKN